MARGDEELVERAFVKFLEAEGWTVRRQVAGLDVEATRGTELLRAEVKGRTGANTGLDVDTMYGQLLRRMRDDDSIYAVVVPREASNAVRRVSRTIRERLRIVVFEVDLETGDVTREASSEDDRRTRDFDVAKHLRVCPSPRRRRVSRPRKPRPCAPR